MRATAARAHAGQHTHREQLARRAVLVVGPNPTFLLLRSPPPWPVTGRPGGLPGRGRAYAALAAEFPGGRSGWPPRAAG